MLSFFFFELRVYSAQALYLAGAALAALAAVAAVAALSAALAPALLCFLAKRWFLKNFGSI
jgi:hypothetical protein